jgi:hypothetical protein
MLLLLSALTAVDAAPPAGFKQTDQAHGCTFYKGPKDANSNETLFADCYWPEATPEKMDQLLLRWDRHFTYYTTVTKSDVVGKKGDKTRVRQVHEAAGISDREVMLLMWKAPAKGGQRYQWTKDTDQSGRTDDGVLPDQDDGGWTVIPDPRGGVRVEYDLLYDPGGSVPGFVVRWFQGTGFVDLVGEMRSAAKP